MLEVRDLVAGYTRGIDIVRGFSLKAEAGQVCAIVGPNGAGKSTLLKAIVGLIPSVAGEVLVDGTNVTGWPARRITAAGVALVAQGHTVFPEMTGRENLLMGAWHLRSNRAACRERIDHVYEVMPELCPHDARQAGLLSGGQQRMLEIGRALMHDPACILLDEPTAGLSPANADRVYDHVALLRSLGKAVVLVDQFVVEAMEVADFGYTMRLGSNERSAPASEMRGVIDSVVAGWLTS